MAFHQDDVPSGHIAANIAQEAETASGGSQIRGILWRTERVPPDLVPFVREQSPFYKAFLSHLPHDVPFSSLPLTDAEAYWAAGKASADNILTKPFRDGVVMRSGGSTGAPKFVYYTRDKLQRICSIKATVASVSSGILPGDRIANLSPMGGMYGSFMFNNTAIMELPIDNVQLPIGGQQPEDVMADTMDKFEATVILTTIYSASKLAGWLLEQQRTLKTVRLILFTGE
ncbi:AMP-dependent synthetase/ligase [Aspergillus affinis]|uniref:AMP-dependent synthetase/ligase n=1 Tax=Aspergillus affinis TaxID=1070780 RepID=UPI0022FDFEB2|nr:AMP-dependent synthetase/ligase [Aspergillus affinis]KAI9044320.1 AMP-dependent synthetase/ligase [Aspergillus affinis]